MYVVEQHKEREKMVYIRFFSINVNFLKFLGKKLASCFFVCSTFSHTMQILSLLQVKQICGRDVTFVHKAFSKYKLYLLFKWYLTLYSKYNYET